MNEERLNKVESLKHLLVARATGGSEVLDGAEYIMLRGALLADQRIAEKLPRFVKTCRSLDEFWGLIKMKSPNYAGRREFLRLEFDPVLTMLETESRTPSDAAISATVVRISPGYVQETWQKALERRTSDPEGAITAARTLLESVCKHILDDAGATYDDCADLPKLYGLTSRQLNLSPSQHTEQLFKQILGGCQTVVEGLGALRNRHSDAHGKGTVGARPVARHAELAVNLAGTMATFLLQTWETRKNS
jgi:Abortive infection C-terminus